MRRTESELARKGGDTHPERFGSQTRTLPTTLHGYFRHRHHHCPDHHHHRRHHHHPSVALSAAAGGAGEGLLWISTATAQQRLEQTEKKWRRELESQLAETRREAYDELEDTVASVRRTADDVTVTRLDEALRRQEAELAEAAAEAQHQQKIAHETTLAKVI